MDRSAEKVFACATDPTHFRDWHRNVIDGHDFTSLPPEVGASCLTARRIGLANRPVTPNSPTSTRPGPAESAASTDPFERRSTRRGPCRQPSPAACQNVDFTGRGIGKLLIPLAVEREARKEMPPTCPRSKNASSAKDKRVVGHLAIDWLQPQLARRVNDNP